MAKIEQGVVTAAKALALGALVLSGIQIVSGAKKGMDVVGTQLTQPILQLDNVQKQVIAQEQEESKVNLEIGISGLIASVVVFTGTSLIKIND